MPPRLKSLELHGYKTFAAHTLFEFAETVTAIVGPNGSGKSNIADSIRWVLGEQSYSLLRGKKTEDMIFSGSEQRSRAGMASATIVFDNSDNWLPIDFTEVAITRRAYRDGENEYLLNGQRVRLKDVSELLAQSGLAERTYTIIGQGLVDAALALKAEERRRLFEEAAGIGLHRARREESLKRLETTRRNLDRVQDILAELQPRLRSLERQARRAADYEQVKADLQVLLREWYGYHWRLAQHDLTEARETARSRETILDRVRADQLSLSEQLETSRGRIQDLRQRLNGWHRQASAHHSQRETISRELAVTEERARALVEQDRSVHEELQRIEEALGFHQERLDEAAKEASRLLAELQDARSEAGSAREALATRQAERRQAEEAANTARQELSNLIARQAHLSARQAERRLQAARREDSLQAARKAIEAGAVEVQSAESRLKSAQEKFQASQAIRQAVEETIAAQAEKLAEVEQTRRQTIEARSAQGAQAARLKAQLEVLDQAEESLAGYQNGARALIQEARKQHLGGARGALGTMLEVPAELEIAVTAALGEFLDAVVFDQAEGLGRALQVLESVASRAAMLPLDALDPGPIFSFPQFRDEREDVVGRAADLVKAAPEIKPAVDLILGRAWIVRTDAAARRLLADLRSKLGDAPVDLRVVTLRGEVYYASGVLIGGPEGKAGTLSRPRQRRELSQAVEEAHNRMGQLENEARDCEGKVLELRRLRETSESDLKNARKAEDEARSALAQADLAAEKARRQLSFQREQLHRLEGESDQAQNDDAEANRQLSELDAAIEAARETSRHQSAGLADLNLDDLQERVSHWNATASVAERAAGDAANRRNDRQSEIDRAMQTRETLTRRLEEIQQGSMDTVANRTLLRATESEIGVQIDALRVLINPAEIELDGVEQEQAALQAKENEARQLLTANEHVTSQARINLARRQEHLESLRQRIEDDFGLVQFEYKEDISGQPTLPLDGLVEMLPVVHELSADIEEAIKRQRAQLRRMGPVNPEAQAEYLEVKERFRFMTEQVNDLHKAEADIKEVIAELDLLMEREFRKTFDSVAHEFREIFTRLFGGGSARLMLTDPDDLTDTGIDIEARLPGRRAQGLSLLSGGERSLTACSLVFALLKVSPTPFCLLDEVDAMLDEANVGRFRDMLRELSANTQFVVVTHNRNTVQAADVIYGVTMGSDSASQVLSLRLDQVREIVD